LASAVVAWPLSARSQERLLPVIGYLDTTSASATAHLVDAFRRGLSTAGYDEGRNVAIEYRWAEGDYEKLPGLAAADKIQRLRTQLDVDAAAQRQRSEQWQLHIAGSPGRNPIFNC